jgi:N-acyl homoserine lactone hydrolase
MPAYRIVPLRTMVMELDMGIFTYRTNYGVKRDIPTWIWFIEGCEKKIIVDSGGDPQFAEVRGITVKEVMRFDDALAQINLKPADIDMIIQTHLHWDHCGNSRRCSQARVLVQERELEFASKPHPLMANTYHPALFEGLKWEPLSGPCEILPGLGVVPAPGHTPGTQAVYVQTERGKCVISGFCCIQENFLSSADPHGTTVAAPGIHTDALAAYDSALLIQGMADILIPQHDPGIVPLRPIPSPDERGQPALTQAPKRRTEICGE